MNILRILLLLIFAAALTGCGTFAPAIQTSDRPIITEPSPEPKKPRAAAPKPATASTISGKDKLNASSPQAGSSEWEKEQAENERKEQRLKQIIQGICRGC
jgi:hypothetical protein